MRTFLFAYRMPKGYRPGSVDALAAWTEFFNGMGEAVIDRGDPVFESATVGSCGERTQLGGYSLIRAENLDEAVEFARRCPALAEGGGVDVGLVTETSRKTEG